MKFFGILAAGFVVLGSTAAWSEEVRPGILRTPDERFANLVDYDFESNYIQIGDYRIHYLDEGPADGEIVLLMHGEPTWSYLYRHMIPPLVGAGHRVIAPDLVGFGKSDKPTARTDYSYQSQVDTFMRFIAELGLNDITLFCQDWGSLVGLRLVTGAPDRFARVVLGNGGLPEGQGQDGFVLGAQWTEPDPTIELNMHGGFLAWLQYSQTVPEFDSGLIVQAATTSDLSQAEMDAYRAPFPDETYKAGARVMPTLVMSQQATNREAWKVLESFEKPFLTTFSDGDPITRGGEQVFQNRVPGAKGQSHRTIENAGHFLQEDGGPEIAALIIQFMKDNPVTESMAKLWANDIPVAHTPPGYWKEIPAPVLAGCTEPLPEGAPDMRGTWEVVESHTNGRPSQAMIGLRQRIEQCGNRVVITAGGVTHDMRCDGTYVNGVNDVGERSTGGRAITVAASFENGVHVLRPKGMNITVEREIVDGDLIWRYGPALVLRCERVETE